ncbi:MAG: DUF6036 family nucleotidyltransferase [Bryobacteraceae bacterium]
MPTPERSPGTQLPEPWMCFFDDLDTLIEEPIEIHCFGGFVLIHVYGVARTTNDIDYVGLIPRPLQSKLTELAGEGSALHRRHGVYLDAVGVATVPEAYQERLIAILSGTWKNVKLFALEAHDLALSKLERNLERDRDDVQRLARAGYLNPETLQSRYRSELRPHLLARETWHDQTMDMWIGSFWPEIQNP